MRATKDVRDRYAAAARDQRNGIEAAVRATGAEHVRLSTDGLWLETLIRYVHRRRHLANRRYTPAGAAR
ncbi:MAG: hypothetical protein R2715_19465 [Ilumatobacteraceae bacterium]